MIQRIRTNKKVKSRLQQITGCIRKSKTRAFQLLRRKHTKSGTPGKKRKSEGTISNLWWLECILDLAGSRGDATL